MKVLLFCVLLAAAIVSSEAVPARSTVMLTKALAKAGKTDGVKDIWSDCSKFSILICISKVYSEPRSISSI